VALRRIRGVGAIIGRGVVVAEMRLLVEGAVEGGWKVKARVEGEKGYRMLEDEELGGLPVMVWPRLSQFGSKTGKQAEAGLIVLG
jgi:hypothetical protein